MITFPLFEIMAILVKYLLIRYCPSKQVHVLIHLKHLNMYIHHLLGMPFNMPLRFLREWFEYMTS